MGMFTDLISPKFTINTNKAVNESQKAEAESLGLELLSRTSDPNYNQYRHKDCGHIDFYQPTHVRRNNIKCSSCLFIKHSIEAHNSGFTLLYANDALTYKYIRPCSHVSVLLPATVRKSAGQQCSQCFSKVLLDSCDDNGYTYKHRTDRCYHTIGFKNCNHEKTVHHSQIIKGNIVCRECSAIDNRQLALDNGLIELSQENDRYFKYQLPCGHEKVLRQDHAIDGSYLCDFCGESHYQKPSKLYLYKFTLNDFSWLKLGFARNLTLRKANYGLDKSVVTELLLSIDFDNGREVMLFEKKLHKMFKEYQLDKKLMKSFHKNNGYSECYIETASHFIVDTTRREYERI